MCTLYGPANVKTILQSTLAEQLPRSVWAATLESRGLVSSLWWSPALINATDWKRKYVCVKQQNCWNYSRPREAASPGNCFGSIIKRAPAAMHRQWILHDSTIESSEDSIVFLVNHITGGWYWETAAPGVTWSDSRKLEPLQFLGSGSVWSWFPVQWLHLLSDNYLLSPRWYFTGRRNRSNQQTHVSCTSSKQWTAADLMVSVMKYCPLTVIPSFAGTLRLVSS